MRRSKTAKKRKLNGFQFETLEAKQLLAADGASLIADSYEAQQNSETQTFEVLANDRFDEDYAGDRVITGVSRGSQGSRIEIAEDGGSLQFTVAADIRGNETFTYFVDGDHSAQVTIRVATPLEDDQFRFDPSQQTFELDVLQNDPFWQDYEGAGQITLVGASTRNADISISEDGGSLLYTPREQVYGVDSFLYVVDDQYPASVQVNMESPLESDRYQMVRQDPAHVLRVLDNDEFWPEYEGERKITHVLDVPESMDVQIGSDGESLVVTPNTTEDRYNNIRYVVDGKFETTVSVVVENPVSDDFVTVDANSTNYFIDVLSNDEYRDIFNFRQIHRVVDSVTSVTQGENGTVRIAEDGRGITYTPSADFVGVDTFTYMADDKFEASVRVSVQQTGTLLNDYYTLYQGTNNNLLNVLSNDFPGNGYQGPKNITSVESVEGADVQISADGKQLLFTPQDPDTYSYSIEYEVDGHFTSRATVSLRSVATYLSFEDDQPRDRYLSIVGRLEIPSNYAGDRVITSVTQPDFGTVTIGPDARGVNFEPNGGSATFQYTLDGKYTGTVSVQYPNRLTADQFVTHQNSPAVSHNVLANDFSSWTEQHWGSYTGNREITDVQVVSGEGTVSIGESGHIVFTPAVDFAGTAQVRYTVDGFLGGNVTIQVPRLVRDDRMRAEPDATETLDVLANDLVGGDYSGPLEITGVTSGSEGGQLSIAPDGKSVSYQALDGFRGTDTFEYTVDGMLKATVTVEVADDASSLYPRVESLEAFQELVLAAAPDPLDSCGRGLSFCFDAESISNDGASLSGGRDFAKTNVQVAGVDEADLIETDSDHIYTLTQGQLVITKAWPADAMEVLSRVDIPGNFQGMYLDGDRVAVVSTRYPSVDTPEDDAILIPVFGGQEITVVTVIDVADRTAPTLVQTTEVDSQFIQTRRIDNSVYLVVRDRQSLAPGYETICDEDDTCRTETEEERIERIKNDFGSVVEEVLPTYESFDGEGNSVRSGLVVQPEDIYNPLTEGASSLVSVITIDMTSDTPGLATTTGVLTTNASDLYMSLENLYVIENHGSWWNQQDAQDSHTTKLMKFRFTDGGGIEFASSGVVPGQTLNQFSMDEHDGHFRIATSIWNSGTGNFTGNNDNALFVLQDDNGVMETVGTLSQLALNETIQSVRFFGDRALVTTYQTIDPLFSIDLSDHAKPTIEGYLTLPGFASYTQFIDSDHVLTIGQGSARAWGSVAVSLFNVADITQPILVDQYHWDGTSSSPATDDHHAFGWFSSHSTLAIPSQVNDWHRVDLDGDGYAEHIETTTDHQLHSFEIDTTLDARGDGIRPKATMELDSKLLRSTFIGDNLYAIGEESIQSANIADPAEVFGEVDISNPDGSSQTHLVHRSPFVEGLWEDARAALSADLGVSPTQIMAVASETEGDRTNLLLRAGDEQYVYNALDSRITLERSDFRPGNAVLVPDWHNTDNPYDVNGDGQASPRDLLVLVRNINDGHGGTLPTPDVLHNLDSLTGSLDNQLKVDVNGDGHFSPADVLFMVLALNEANQQLEQEAAASEPPAVDALFAAFLQDEEDE